MPIEKCTLPSGGNGFRYGQKGHCYPNKKSAIKQGLKISYETSGGPDKFKSEMSKKKAAGSVEISEEEFETALLELSKENKKQFGGAALDYLVNKKVKEKEGNPKKTKVRKRSNENIN